MGGGLFKMGFYNFNFDWGSIEISMGWSCNQDWGFNRADTVENLFQKDLGGFRA